MHPKEDWINDDELDQVIGGTNNSAETPDKTTVYELPNLKNELSPNYMLARDISDQH